jgi:hypothetical protein
MSLAIDSQGAANSKLPLWNMIRRSYQTYFYNFPDVLRISSLWLVLIAVLTGMANRVQWSWGAAVLADMKPGTPWQSLAPLPRPAEAVWLGNTANLILLLAGISIALAWHRRVILGEHPGLSGSNVVARSMWQFVRAGLAICIIVIVPGLILALIVFLTMRFWLHPLGIGGVAKISNWQFTILMPMIFFAYLAASIAVVLRLILLLPARAAGDLALTFKETWNRTRGNVWRIFLGIAACALPPTLAGHIIVLGLFGFGPSMFAGEVFAEWMAVTSTVSTVYYLLVTPVAIGFLSYAYQYFSHTGFTWSAAYGCYNCLNPIPANTLICPHCGEVQRRGARPHDRKYYLAIVLSAIVLIGWNWYSGGQKTHEVASPPSAGLPSR